MDADERRRALKKRMTDNRFQRKDVIFPVFTALIFVLLIFSFSSCQSSRLSGNMAVLDAQASSTRVNLATATSFMKTDCWWQSSTCNEIQFTEEELKKPDLPGELRQKYTALLDGLYAVANLEATSVSKLTGMPTEVAYARSHPGTPVSLSTTEKLRGIFEGPVPFSSYTYHINNLWSDYVIDHDMIVYAGALAPDPEQGVLVVYNAGNDRSSSNTSIYLTPAKEGSVRIVEAENYHLKLETENKNNLFFDVIHPAFVSSFTEKGVATLTPFQWPTATPSVVPTPN